ncbi:MAG: response regulator [Thermoplasmata archaeon]|nr:response regulator [Thermoplasmata archaeon]
MEPESGRPSRTRVMIVEDEKLVAEDVRRVLINMGYDVPSVVSSGEKAIEAVATAKPDIILMDIRLGKGIDGLETAERIGKVWDLPIIYLTAYADEDTLQRAKLTDPFGYVLKPFESRELHTTIQIALYKHGIESRLRESEERYRTLAENSPTGIFILKKGRFVYANRTLADLLGKDAGELSGTYITDIVHRADGERLREAYEGALKGGVCQADVRMRTRKGLRWMDVIASSVSDGGSHAVMGIAVDITDRRVLEVEAHRAQKLDAMSAMGLGLAHELNNIMNTVIGAAQLVHARTREEDLREWLDEIQKGGKRASRLINQIMDVSAITSEATEHSAKLLVKGTVKLMGMSLPGTVSVSVQADPGNYRVIASPVDIQSILVHLIEHAVEAMPKDAPLGKAQVNVRMCNLAPGEASDLNLATGEYISIEVLAPGAGLSESGLERALDPAHALGADDDDPTAATSLARVREMVTRNHGVLRIEMSNEGPIVRIVIPALAEAREPLAVRGPRPGGG